MQIKDFLQAKAFFKDEITLSEGEVNKIIFGKLHVSIKKYLNEYHLEWWLHRLMKSEIKSENSDFAKKNIKLILDDQDEKLAFLPALPDKPIILKSNQPLKISSGTKCRFYILLPIFIQLVRRQSGNQILLELSSVPVYKSWFGDMDTGVLGYHQLSSFYQEINDLSSKYFQLICPLEIHNRSGVELVFDKLLLQCSYLSIFQGKKNFWTNEISVNYTDDTGRSLIKISQKAPTEEVNLQKIVQAKDALSDNLVMNTFEKIKKLAGV